MAISAGVTEPKIARGRKDDWVCPDGVELDVVSVGVGSIEGRDLRCLLGDGGSVDAGGEDGFGCGGVREAAASAMAALWKTIRGGRSVVRSSSASAACTPRNGVRKVHLNFSTGKMWLLKKGQDMNRTYRWQLDLRPERCEINLRSLLLGHDVRQAEIEVALCDDGSGIDIGGGREILGLVLTEPVIAHQAARHRSNGSCQISARSVTNEWRAYEYTFLPISFHVNQ